MRQEQAIEVDGCTKGTVRNVKITAFRWDIVGWNEEDADSMAKVGEFIADWGPLVAGGQLSVGGKAALGEMKDLFATIFNNTGKGAILHNGVRAYLTVTYDECDGTSYVPMPSKEIEVKPQDASWKSDFAGSSQNGPWGGLKLAQALGYDTTRSQKEHETLMAELAIALQQAAEAALAPAR